MPPRSSWKGSIKLHLVSVPVKAYTANASGAQIHLNQLHSDCHSRIKCPKVCPIHGEVSRDAVVSGYEYAKGQFVEVRPDELSKLHSQGDKVVRIEGFLPPGEIDPVYYKGKTYYLMPDGPVGQKPYALLHKGMLDKGLVALARRVLSKKEQLVLLQPVGNLLAMSSLSYGSQIKKAESFEGEISPLELSRKELELTDTLIEASMLGDLDYSQYKDAYSENLAKLIEAKVEGREIISAPVTEEPQVINLMEALKASVKEASEKNGAWKMTKKKTAKKMAPSICKKTAAKSKKKIG